MPGVTFHYLNVVVDWYAIAGKAYELDVDLLSPWTGWLMRQSTLTLVVDAAATPAGSAPSFGEKVVDFRQKRFPDFLLRTEGLAGWEDWGRWSDANLSEAVLLRFFQPLPRKFQLRLTCKATPPNAGRPVQVKIGQVVREFSPTASIASYDLDFVLDGEERNIRFYPPCPTSPASLNPASQDRRLVGIGLVELKLTPGHIDDCDYEETSGTEAALGPTEEEMTVIDFRRSELPDSVIQVQGLSAVEDWGRWSDANLAEAVTLQFLDVLPRKLRLELTCIATDPNAGRPVVVEIGENRQIFEPTKSLATYRIDFVLDLPEQTIRFIPPAPTSPAALGVNDRDHRRLGIGFVELTIISVAAAPADVADPIAPRVVAPTRREEDAYWDGVYSQEDPWGYQGDYEQKKYAHTLELLPPGPIGRALEIGCAEGLFTEMLAPRVGRVLGLDISELALSRARARCRRLANVSFERADVSDHFPQGAFDLIVCSEVLYYLRDRPALKKLVRRIADSLAPHGHLLMTHSNSVNDDKTATGFDFNEIGAVFIGEQLAEEPALDFLKELRTPLYRVQLFRRRRALYAEDEPLDVRKYPREVTERPATFAHPHLKWGGCAVTSSEAQYFYDTAEVPILMYHRIASDGPPRRAPYRLDPASFERQLAYLQRYGYSTTNVEAIWQFNCVPGSRMHGKWVSLTFDDGYQDFADVASPLLRRYGFTATVFLPTDYVGGRAEWDRELGEPARLMDWETIRRLAKEGVSFGSHSCTHRRLASLGPADLAKEVRRSHRILENELGAAPLGFCFPYADFSRAVIDEVKKAGYDFAVAGDVPCDLAHNPFALPRIEICNDDDLDRFISKLPPPLPSDEKRRAEYRRMRAVRHRGTYLHVEGSPTSAAPQAMPEAAGSDDSVGSADHPVFATPNDVIRLYRDLLGREPESDQVIQGRLRQPVVDVALDIALSKEFFARVRAMSAGPEATREEVIQLYRLLHERKPESEQAVAAQIGRPIVDLVADIVNSSEFSEFRFNESRTADDIEKLHELLLPDIQIGNGTAQEIARIAHCHHVRLPAVAGHMLAMSRAKRAVEKGEAFAGLGWTEPIFGKFKRIEAYGDRIELVVPTVNSERWLGRFLKFYRSAGIRAVYAVDRRTSDGTQDLLRNTAFHLSKLRARSRGWNRSWRRLERKSKRLGFCE
ncbi:MAG: polysaccharide deacetylase family protein [Hyphomicrobiales bacterium]|nr:polysaccharide deacetylase family protein [Hyphomicrobiales bacterium]